VAVTVRPTLREIDLGAWDGLRREQIETRFPGEWRKRGDRFDTYRPQGGETFLELQQRAVSAYCSALAEDDGNLLIVAHAGVHRAILSYLLEMPVRNIMRLAQAPGCMNIVSERDGLVRVEGINIHPGEHPVLGGTP
jgi:probable phosphoglycerate mutase